MLDVTDYEFVWPPELLAAEARRLLDRPRLGRQAIDLLLREAFHDESAAAERVTRAILNCGTQVTAATAERDDLRTPGLRVRAPSEPHVIGREYVDVTFGPTSELRRSFRGFAVLWA